MSTGKILDIIPTIGPTISRTMLIERFFGIAAYDSCVLLVYLLLNGCKSKAEVKRVLRFSCCALSVLGFFFVPDSSKDLYRWLQLSAGWPQLPFRSFITDIALKSNTPVAYTFIYLCRLTGFDGTLPAICALVFYGNVFHVLLMIDDVFDAAPKDISLAYIFFMCSGTFLEVISGVRCLVAYSIVFGCFCAETLRGRSVTLSVVPYLIAVLTHLAVAPMLAIRFFYLIAFERSDKKAKRISNLAIVVLFTAVFLWRGHGLIQASIDKARSYLTYAHYKYPWEVLLGFMKFALTAYVLRKWRASGAGEKLTLSVNPSGLALAYLVTATLFAFEYSIFHRLIAPVSLLTLPAVVTTNKSLSGIEARRYQATLRLCSLLILFVASARGDLCGYKFFVLG